MYEARSSQSAIKMVLHEESYKARLPTAAIRSSTVMSRQGRVLPPPRSFMHVPRSEAVAHRNLILQRNLLAVTSLCLLLVVIVLYKDVGSSSSSSLDTLRIRAGQSECSLNLGEYRGPQYYSPESGSLGQPKCLLESKWLKVSQHSVRFPGSSTTFDDWMWIDYHDRINVLVEANPQEIAAAAAAADGTDNNERRFLVFEQTKYALEGRASLAIIGGIIEAGETPEASARREVEEEMNGLQCKTFHFLGRYRTDVNRGMGWVNAFWATDCGATKERSHPNHQDSGGVLEKVVGAADTERQDLRSVTLTQLKDYVRNGKFIEVQWTATVALALLHPDLS